MTTNITIVGGSGFVGSQLIKSLLEEEKKVISIDKNLSLFYPRITDVQNILNIHQLNFDPSTGVVIHLAAEHRDDVFPISLYYDVNVQGTKNVLSKMDEMGIKNLIFTSSVAIYGLNKTNPNEEHPADPFNHYGKSKWEAEQVIKEWYERDSEGKSVTIIRPTVIFGERNRGNVYNLLRQISSGKFMMIGKGYNKKSMAYVGNVVAFIKDRIDKKELGYRKYNYADKPDFTMSELSFLIENKLNLSISRIKIPYWLGMLGGYGFDLLALITRKKYSISSVRVKKFCATTQFDAAKAHSTFRAPYTLEEGLNNTLDFEFVNSKEDDIRFYSE
jgi:GlcNAc-P-P-Und epimerase